MRFRSTRDAGGQSLVPFSTAVERGLAPDGGLYVPASLPRLDPADFDAGDVAGVAARILAPFLVGDRLAPEIGAICRAAFDFPIPLVDIEPGTAILELYWGPTAAFKDVGARFLAQCMARLRGRRLVLVATSGDTGGAVAAAFWRQPDVEVAVLFPADGVSARQRQQLTCWGENVRAFAVRGVFDDCQRIVKEAFADAAWAERLGATSANSISIGRLLPQTIYYATASLQHLRRHGRAPGFVVPTGNLGNAMAALWARRMGFPVREVALATNANRPIPAYLETGRWEPRPTVATLANAMDVGAPSNVERLIDLYPHIDELRAVVTAQSVDDATIRAVIAATPRRWGRVVCPHTATAVHVRDQLGPDEWIVVATAHPAKFESTVEPLVGGPVDVPPALAALLDRPSSCTTIDPTLGALRGALEAGR